MRFGPTVARRARTTRAHSLIGMLLAPRFHARRMTKVRTIAASIGCIAPGFPGDVHVHGEASAWVTHGLWLQYDGAHVRPHESGIRPGAFVGDALAVPEQREFFISPWSRSCGKSSSPVASSSFRATATTLRDRTRSPSSPNRPLLAHWSPAGILSTRVSRSLMHRLCSPHPPGAMWPARSFAPSPLFRSHRACPDEDASPV